MNQLVIVTKEFSLKDDANEIEQLKNEIKKYISLDSHQLPSGDKKNLTLLSIETDSKTAGQLKPILKKIKGVAAVHIEQSNKGPGEKML